MAVQFNYLPAPNLIRVNYLSWDGCLAVETLGAGDTPPVTFVLCGVMVEDAGLVVPEMTRHTLHTLIGDRDK